MATARGEAAKTRRRSERLFPSRDVDVQTALELFAWSHYRFARSTEALSAEELRPVLDALTRAHPADPAVLFLRSAVDERDLERSWRAAVNALKLFGSMYAWGSKQKREKLAAVAKAPRLLAATQAATAASASVADEYLAVLVLDGSDESVDALLPHFDRALKDPTRLEALERLRTYAKKTPALEALLGRVDAERAARAKSSPVQELARRLDLMRGERFRVDVSLEAGPSGRLDVRLDSEAPAHFSIWLRFGSYEQHTAFDGVALRNDKLGLGASTLDELPGWVARAEKKLGVKFERSTARATHLRGARLTAFLAWLLG